jgi:enolase
MKIPAATIETILAREVLDSRGNPTVEVEVHCTGGTFGRAMVPSGASTGRHEAKELRDDDSRRFGGKGVRRAVTNVRQQIGPHFAGFAVTDQSRIDQELRDLDGTPDKSRLGANAVLGVSLACAHAAAAAERLSLWRYLARLAGPNSKPRLPMPMVNMISGGLHAGCNLDFQDFLVIPLGAKSFGGAMEIVISVYRSLGTTLIEHGFEGVLVGDEGGYGPNLPSNEQAIEMILRAIERAGYKPGEDAGLALDVASTHFYCDGRYRLRATGGTSLTAEELVMMLATWVDHYPIISIEDGLAEDDWAGWKVLTQSLGKRIQLIGDDLFVTNPDRLRQGIRTGVANSILVKPNQVGTLTETLEVIALAQSAGYRTVVSARSGETEDTTIADLAVATGAGQIKIGSVVRSERLAKYNQLLRIEEEMGEGASFAAWLASGPTLNHQQ